MPKLNIADAMMNVNTNQDSIDLVMHDAPLSVQTRFYHLEKISGMAVAQANQRNADMDKWREELADVESRRGHWVRDHQRSGAQMPKGSLEKYDLEIKLLKDKLRNPHVEGRIFLSNYSETADYAKRVRRFVPADLPDAFDVDEESFAAVQAATKKLRAELGKTELTPRTKDEIRAQVVDELDMLEKAGKPSLREMANPPDINSRTGKFEVYRGRHFITWPQQFATRGDESTVFNALAFDVWKDRATIEKRLLADIDARKEGITGEEKTARVADLHEKIVTSLRLESELLMALEIRGNLSLRNSNYHPAVNLGLEAPAHLVAEYT